MKPCQKPATSLNQDNIIQLTFHKSSTWMQQAKRLYNDGHKKFHMVCFNARLAAQEVVFPSDDSFFTLINNMVLLEKDPYWLNCTIDKIEEIYNEAYSISNQADIIPFPMFVQGGAK